jgi:predicted P-loop ATPase
MNERAPNPAPENELEAFLRWVGHRDGDPVELRVLKPKGGPIIDVQRASMELSRRALAHERVGNVYLVPNEVRPDFPRGTAVHDPDVTHRRVFVIDVDPVRPVNVSATEAERLEAERVTDAIASRLASLGAGEALARGMSGSGYWLMLALDRLASTPGLTDLATRLLVALAALHGSDAVKVDPSVYNASRIIPAWGTMKRKGDNTPERPHRRTWFQGPAKAQPLTLEAVTRLVEAVEAEVPASTRQASPRPSARAVGAATDSPFALANATPIRIVADALGLEPRDQGESVVVRCPRGCHERELPGGTGVVLLPKPNVMKCSHATCAGERNGVRTAVDLWAEVRGGSSLEAALAVCELAGVVVPMRPGLARVRRATTHAAAADADADLPLVRTRQGAIAKTTGNIARVLRGHPAWEGVLGYNDRTAQLVFLKAPPFASWRAGTPLPAEMADRHGGDLSEWLEDEFNGWAPAPDLCLSTLMRVAAENAFDPFKDWLRALPDWDGECRLDSWLAQYLGVEDSEYTRAVGAKFLISSLARTFKPGSKVDHVLVLEGEQGIGKTSAIQALFGAGDPSWVASGMAHHESKDAADFLQGPVVVELAEATPLRRADVETLKAFLTRDRDRYRPSYGRLTIERPRRCVFVATTNQTHYLSDPTGNRRFWPVTCTPVVGDKVDRDGLRAAAPLLWAEALRRYEEGATWHLDERLTRRAELAQAARVEADGWEETLAQHLDEQPITWAGACLDLLNIPVERRDTKTMRRLAAILRRHGFTQQKTQVRRGGTRVYEWHAPRARDRDRDAPAPVSLPVYPPDVDPFAELASMPDLEDRFTTGVELRAPDWTDGGSTANAAPS